MISISQHSTAYLQQKGEKTKIEANYIPSEISFVIEDFEGSSESHVQCKQTSHLQVPESINKTIEIVMQKLNENLAGFDVVFAFNKLDVYKYIMFHSTF